MPFDIFLTMFFFPYIKSISTHSCSLDWSPWIVCWAGALLVLPGQMKQDIAAELSGPRSA